MSEKHDDLNLVYNKIMTTNHKQKWELRQLTKHTTDLPNKYDNKLKLDELEQYDRRQNLEMVGVPYNETENATKVAIDLAETLGVKLNEDITITHCLPSKQLSAHTRQGKPESNIHPLIKVKFVNQYKRNELYEN